jgi:hypothetical protein
MATSYTSLLGLALPVTGELQGTWGDTVNNAITSLLDSAVAGTTSLTTDADVTLTTTTGAANEARAAVLLCSGARTAIRSITAPAQSKVYVVVNATTGGYPVVLRGVGPTTGVSIPAGVKALIAWNTSDFVIVSLSGPRVTTIADATTLTVNADTTDIAVQANTQVAGTLTIGAPTGTPTNGQRLIIRIRSTNVQTFSWNAAFAGSSDLALPTATSGSSLYDYVGFLYNSTASKWQLVAKVFGF